MRILRTIESFYPFISGPANQAFKISEVLEKEGISSPILTTFYHADDSPPHEKMGKVDVYRYKSVAGFMKYLYSPDMKRGLSDFDIIHSHNYRSYQTAAAYSAARKEKKPFVLSPHGSLLGYRSFVKGIGRLPYGLYDAVGKRIPFEADAVVVASRMEFDEALLFGVKEDRLHIIPMGIDVDEYEPVKKDSHERRLLWVGRISRDRNLEPIIRAMPRMEGNLTVVGKEVKRSDASKGGYLTELQALARKLGIEKRVIFVGEKKGEELRSFYRSSDLFIYTSVWENFGQSILEAAAAGLPIVSTPVGIAPEIVTDDKGVLLENLEPDTISSAVEAAEGMDKEHIREGIRKAFSWPAVTKRYLNLYRGLLER
jgi:glycosyltransferase involved in cell wall biosynthesis